MYRGWCVKVEQNVSALIEEWQQASGKTFSVYGQTFGDFVKKQHTDYAADKENEKMQRVSIAFLALNTVPGPTCVICCSY